MKKIYVLLTLFMMLFIEATAQQEVSFTQYTYNMNVLNPAYAGSRETTNVSALIRQQWSNFKGSPETFTLTMDTPLSKSLGLGISFINDKIGPVSENNIYADLSYTIDLDESSKLAFGVKAGFTLFDVKLLTTVVDPDPLNQAIDETFFNFGAGIYYYTDRFYLGLSVPNMLKTKHLDRDNLDTHAAEVSHYFLTTGYVFNLSENFKLKPSTMIIANEGSPLSIDLSLSSLINDRVELGVSHRFDSSFSGTLGFHFGDNLILGMTYEHSTTDLGDYNDGTYEAYVMYNFGSVNPPESPRFF